MKDKNNKSLFIKTKDKETSEMLQAEGFQLIDYSNGAWTFANNPDVPLTFDNKKVAYSNMLCI